MQEQKGLTTNGLNLSHTFLILLSVSIIGTCLYLTQHYFDMHFASGDISKSNSLCNINSFFTCDSATMSKMSNIAGVPIAFPGLMFGLSLLFGSFFPSAAFERTNKSLALINLVGCVGLFLFSLIALKTLCPFCTLYYILSGLVFFLFFRYGDKQAWAPDIKILSLISVITLGGSLLVYNHQKDLAKKQNAVSNSVIDQFYKLPNLGVPKVESAFYLTKSAEFGKAPLNVMVFSDFQCPFCKVAGEQWEELGKHYQGKINVSYYFYPLDNNCNPNMKNPMHPLACKAAYVAACAPDFKAAHDDIFKHQEGMTDAFLESKIKALGIETCVKDPATKEKIVALIGAGDQFKLRSTPTIILNGVKIEGTLPNPQFINLMDEIIKRGN